MKLAKNPFECFAIETEVPGVASNHKKDMELPIMIVSTRDWHRYKLPTDLIYDMTITASNLKRVKNVIESMKNLAPQIEIYIKCDGVLAFIVEKEDSTTACQFEDLPTIVHTKDDQSNDLTETVCIVNARKLASILASNHFQNVYTSVSIRKDHSLKLDFEIKRDVVLTCILPAMYRDSD